ncbi:MucR family transcriptional regulator [Gluconacetobacter sacchari]|uniref:MucR family transcriptional regulator n=2 Tax=Gluconacetobacter sacchari TaxID=92759 RepID=A0A7W4IGQ6_9PROT|nr:MucR family transcriptional regulator [Gluconacetobacter sacchari]MBB2162556.1 MucR family transcriptional regulator [Gluconacetobacter sacchari]GBQ31153.1 Ros/MucR family transcriptional regulator [Gluconacetobacter sacchari DSM 12717]
MSSQLQILTTQIAAAYVSHTRVPAGALPPLLTSIYDTLAGLGAAVETPAALIPAVPPKRSVFPDYIVCLEDGRKFKILKRHLVSAYHLTPDQYRARWNLPADYPMVAPNYSLHRARLAKAAGLGLKEVPPAESSPDVVDGVVVTRIPAGRRGRRRRV